jgi:hypothetical protein
MEKVCYDTFQAYRGHDIYTDGPKKGAGGGFPSGGSGLPSFSLIAVRKGDKDKGKTTKSTSTGTTTSVGSSTSSSSSAGSSTITAVPEIKSK